MRFLLLVIFFVGVNAMPGSAQQTIKINTGRQLFVDDYLIAQTNLQRLNHKPDYFTNNPIVKPDKPWELNAEGDPYAAPFSGGVWYDEAEKKFKMWYSAGGGKKHGLVTCYAESVDGRNWIKPVLAIVPGTNIVDQTEHDCVSVLLDKFETDKSKRYKMFVVEFNSGSSVSMKLKYSADGIHWSQPVAVSGELYDRCAAYYDPFRQQYVLSLKTLGEYRRSRNFLAHTDPELMVSLAHRTFDKTSDKYIRYWFHADDNDPRHPGFPAIRPQIYNHEAIPYESLLLGYFTVWQGPENDVSDSLDIQKRNEVLVGWSRDGFQWDRRNKTVFLPVSESREAWNAGNVQSAGGNPVIVGDSLYFYMSGRYNHPKWQSNFSTGLATLRRDGFVSMHTDEEGSLTTHNVLFNGNYFFVNADVKGELRVELLDAKGKPIPGYTKGECTPMKVNSTKYLVQWKNKPGVAGLKNKQVKLKFYLADSDLYSFWLSPWKTGESRGYTSAGGPGLNASGTDKPSDR